MKFTRESSKGVQQGESKQQKFFNDYVIQSKGYHSATEWIPRTIQIH